MTSQHPPVPASIARRRAGQAARAQRNLKHAQRVDPLRTARGEQNLITGIATARSSRTGR